MAEFERENRYVVIKRKDIDKYLSDTEKDKLFAVCESIIDGRSINNKPSIRSVVVEHDWPEYEPVWEMIQARMEGRTPDPLPDTPTIAYMSGYADAKAKFKNTLAEAVIKAAIAFASSEGFTAGMARGDLESSVAQYQKAKG